MEVQEVLNRLIDFETVIKTELLAAIPVALGLVWKRIKSQLGPERLETLTSIARVAVFAAEELGHKGDKVGETISGSTKLEFATGRLRELAERAGLKVTDKEARALLEAVLHEVRPYAQLPDLDLRSPDAPAFEAAH